MKIINKLSRKVLNEGRDFGLGFALLKRKGNNYTTVQPISPCRDYLNDVVYSEITGKPCAAYGIQAIKNDIFDDFAYLIVKICPKMDGSPYAAYDKDMENFNKNYLKIQKFVRIFERRLKIKSRTSITKIKEYKDLDGYVEEAFLIKAPLEWAKGTYLISLHSLLLRAGMYYTVGDVMEYLTKGDYYSEDKYLVGSVLEKIKYLLTNGLQVQDFSTLTNGYSIHNCGLVSYKLF